MKKIGLIMVTLSSMIMENVYDGIRHTCKEYGYTTFTNAICPSFQATEEYNHGEYAVFRDFDYTEFDALVVILNTILSDDIRKDVIAMLKKYDKPIVSIDYNIDGAYNLLTSNFDGMKENVLHLINEHNARKINFITGPDDNEEAVDRLRAYKSALAESGIPYEEERVYHGTFFVQDDKAVDYFEKSKIARDYDAIVCSNDMVAVSVGMELKRRGKRIPQDVILTGFDGIEQGSYFDPPLTTIVKPEYEIGVRAIETLHKIFEGEEVEEGKIVPSRLVAKQSCGCIKCDSMSLSEVSKLMLGNFTQDALSKDENKVLGEILATCDSEDEFFDSLKTYVKRINPKGFCFLLYKDMLNEISSSMIVESESPISVPIFYLDGKFYPKKDITFNQIGKFITDAGADDYMCAPVHYRGSEFGYIFFFDSDFPLKSYYFDWIRGVSNGIKGLRDRKLFKSAISRLEGMYVKDQMTGLYNRYGLEIYFKRFSDYCDENSVPLAIMFIDMNGLKTINDVYGHDDGDYAIRTISTVLATYNTADSIAVRYGGDEFILLKRGCNISAAKRLLTELQNKLEMFNQISGKEYSISASMGFFIKSPNDNLSMKQCIKSADNFMYENKVRYHESIKNQES